MKAAPFVHPSVIRDDSVLVGHGSKVWHFAQLRTGATIGDECVIGRDVYIDEGVRIGDRVKIQNRVSIYRDCIIEDGVFIGPHVVFTNDMYPRAVNPDGALKAASDWHAGSTIVKLGASIGAGSIILPSTTIGRYSLIGAGSIVTRDVPDQAIILGNPGRIVGYACICAMKLLIDCSGAECSACGRTYSIKVAGGGKVSNLESITLASDL